MESHILHEPHPTNKKLWRYVALVAAGAFATTFAQQRILANLPTTFLLKDQFKLGKEEVALFFFWATFAWNLKPIMGIFTDAFPLFGTRRRHYMLVGSLLAALLWLAMGAFSSSYQALLVTSILMNLATVLASTVMGGMMVEAGQHYGAPGRMASLRQFVQSIASVLGPMLGGYLAAKAFGITTGIAAGSVFLLFVLTFFVHKEAPVPPPDPSLASPTHRRHTPGRAVWIGMGVIALLGLVLSLFPMVRSIGISLFALLAVLVAIVGLAIFPTHNPVVVRAQDQLAQIFESRTLWMAVIMLFLVFTVPGLNTALVYQQSDVMKFSPEYIGQLSSIEGAAGIICSIAYGILCRRLNLRTLILSTVGLSGLVTFLFLTYTQGTAPTVHALSGFFAVASELALMDLAVRSTPEGCEALGFSLMMSIRNFGLSLSDVIGTAMMDHFQVSFSTMVTINSSTTLLVLAFVPFLPAAIIMRSEDETGTEPA